MKVRSEILYVIVCVFFNRGTCCLSFKCMLCIFCCSHYTLLFVSTDEDNVYFLIQSVPTYIVTIIKGLIAREVLRQCPEVR